MKTIIYASAIALMAVIMLANCAKSDVETTDSGTDAVVILDASSETEVVSASPTDSVAPVVSAATSAK
ncbi:MAG: hypothetical protein WCT07_04200 [Candidatus Paceibacterota bacterium]|jgi:hypothetical protein